MAPGEYPRSAVTTISRSTVSHTPGRLGSGLQEALLVLEFSLRAFTNYPSLSLKHNSSKLCKHRTWQIPGLKTLLCSFLHVLCRQIFVSAMDASCNWPQGTGQHYREKNIKLKPQQLQWFSGVAKGVSCFIPAPMSCSGEHQAVNNQGHIKQLLTCSPQTFHCFLDTTPPCTLQPSVSQ